MADATKSTYGMADCTGKPVKQKYGPLEIQSEWKRELAKEALEKLWDAMDLSRRRGGIQLPGESHMLQGVYDWTYHLIGEMLLGDDCPEKEVNT